MQGGVSNPNGRDEGIESGTKRVGSPEGIGSHQSGSDWDSEIETRGAVRYNVECVEFHVCPWKSLAGEPKNFSSGIKQVLLPHESEAVIWKSHSISLSGGPSHFIA